jgi:hypothetical protein
MRESRSPVAGSSFDAYRDELVQDRRAHDLIIRAVDCRAITTSQVPKVVDEWRNPTQREFRPRNLWSLFNAFTEAYKGQSPAITMNRSEALHGLCDGVVWLAN